MPYYPKKKRAARKPRAAMSRSKVATSRKRLLLLSQIVKRQMNNVIETKIADYSFAPLGPLSSLYHNVWYRFEGDPSACSKGRAIARP